MNVTNIEIRETKLDSDEDIDTYLRLTSLYMSDEMGEGTPWTDEQKKQVVADLQVHPAKLILLASHSGTHVGICTCFIGYGTFLAKGIINVHDLFVEKKVRGKGVGRALLSKVKEIAKEKGFGKVTLEVRNDNFKAQALYQSEGFGEARPPMLFWSHYLT